VGAIIAPGNAGLDVAGVIMVASVAPNGFAGAAKRAAVRL